MRRDKKHRIVILGGSFGGLTTAHTLRRVLPRAQAEIAVVSKDDRFYFVPSLKSRSISSSTSGADRSSR